MSLTCESVVKELIQDWKNWSGNAQQLAKAYGLKYKAVKTNTGLRWALKSFFKPSSKPKILEVKTPRRINDRILLNYFKAMQKS